jgi:hypothetical protein
MATGNIIVISILIAGLAAVICSVAGPAAPPICRQQC